MSEQRQAEFNGTDVHPDDAYDVVVIGSGPGGYVAAGRAGGLGLRTALVERAELGGICLNWGCIPTKALLHGAEVVRTVKSAGEFGVYPPHGALTIDLDRLVAHSRATSAQLTSGVAALMEGNGVTVIRGSARVADKGRVAIDSADGGQRLLGAEHIIVATGAGPRGLPGITPDGQTIWTYREALVPDHVPESLVVVGSGAVGAEFASLYADLGSRVTLLEALPHVLPGESEQAAGVVASSLSHRGVSTEAGVQVRSVDVVGPDDGPTEHGGTAGSTGTGDGRTHAVVRYGDSTGAEHELECEKVLLAVGVTPNSSGLGLEDLGVVGPPGFIGTDDYGKTDVWGLYAIGDVAGGPCLAHKATTEALRCVDAIAGVEREPVPADWRAWLPRCTYTAPEVASIGLSAQAAADAGHQVVSKPIPMAQNGRALGAGETNGYGAVVVDAQTQAVLGAELVGEGVTELIGMLGVAHAGGMGAEALSKAAVPHPSRSELVHESVMADLGRPVNSL